MFASACTVSGMIVPAVIFVPVNRGTGGALAGWAIPTATDIASPWRFWR